MTLSLTKPKPVAVDNPLWNVPSITKQTPWPCGIFNFGKVEKKGVDFFNCGLVRRPDGLWLIVRRATWGHYDKLGHNDLVAFKLWEDLTPQHMVPIQMGRRWPIEHFEDPRVMIHNGRVFISCCNFVRNNKGCTFPHQIVVEVSPDWKFVQRFDPVYGNNGNDVSTQLSWEKNWHAFVFDNKPYMVYQASPHTVLECDWNFQVTAEHVVEWDSSVWKYGLIRGGTNSVLKDGLRYSFFHSSLPFKQAKRQYFVGCYAFDEQPPFTPRLITPDPIWVGSVQDGGFPGKPPCVFCTGLILRGNEWIVTGGVNDLKCFHANVPHNELKGKMICVDMQKV